MDFDNGLRMIIPYKGHVIYILAIGGKNMEQPKSSKKPFPKREQLPYSHQPDQDGRSDYGRDGETTMPHNKE